MSRSTRIDETPRWLTQYQFESSTGLDLEDKQIKALDEPNDIGPSSKRRKSELLAEPQNDFYDLDKKIANIEDFRTRKMLQALREHMRLIVVPSRQDQRREEVYAQINDSIFDKSSGFTPSELTHALQVFSEKIGVESFILPREYGLYFENKIPFVTGGKYILKFIPLQKGEKMPIIEEMDHNLARFLDRSYAQASYINGKVNKPVFFLHPEVRDGDECIADDLTEYGLKKLHDKVGTSSIIKDMGGTPHADIKLCGSVEDALGGLDRAIPPHYVEWLIENHELRWDQATNSIVIMDKKKGSTEADRGKAYKLLFTALPGEIGVREATSADAVLDLLK